MDTYLQYMRDLYLTLPLPSMPSRTYSTRQGRLDTHYSPSSVQLTTRGVRRCREEVLRLSRWDADLEANHEVWWSMEGRRACVTGPSVAGILLQ